MAAPALWQPQEQGLREICTLLEAHISPNSDQARIWQQLQHFSQFPDFNNYLVFLLARGEGQSVEVRQAAGLLLKNNLRTTFSSMPPPSQQYIKSELLPCIGATNRAIRSTVGTVISVLFQIVRVGGWVELFQALHKCLDSNDLDHMEGAMDAIYKICEDVPEELDVDVPGLSERPINVFMPRILQFFQSPHASLRKLALGCINQYIVVMPSALYMSMDQYLQGLFNLAKDPSADVRKLVCSAWVQLIEVRPSILKPHLKNVTELILQANKDSDDEVALEACEFWSAYYDVSMPPEGLREFLPRLIPSAYFNFEQGHNERAEMEQPKLKKIEAKADKQELQFGSWQALTNLNEVGEATLGKDSAESDTGEGKVNWLQHSLSAVNEERDTPMKDQSILNKQETGNDDDDSSLKDMLASLNGMDKMFIALERTMDELISHQQDKSILNERSKVQSLEQEIDQLRSQVALLQSKLDHGGYSASSTKVPCAEDTLAVDCEGKPKLNETKDCLREVQELKGQVDGAKKQPVVIEIFDNEDNDDDDDENLFLKSNDSGSGEPGSYEWFVCGNKLKLSSGMKKHLRELCGCVPPQIPFYVHQINRSNLKKRGNMLFSANYSSKPLLSWLDKGAGYVHFEVDGEECGIVRLVLTKNGRANLTSGWGNVVAIKDIKVGDICAFHFRVSVGVLKLCVYVLQAA